MFEYKTVKTKSTLFLCNFNKSLASIGKKNIFGIAISYIRKIASTVTGNIRIIIKKKQCNVYIYSILESAVAQYPILQNTTSF